MTEPFWERPISTLTDEEWEALCDRCGQCCLHRLNDPSSGKTLTTRVICQLFDIQAGQCGDYAERHKTVPDCFKLTPDNVGECWWLPETCGYRRRWKSEPLPFWHPALNGGSRKKMDEYGISVRGNTKIKSEKDVPEDEWSRLIWKG